MNTHWGMLDILGKTGMWSVDETRQKICVHTDTVVLTITSQKLYMTQRFTLSYKSLIANSLKYIQQLYCYYIISATSPATVTAVKIQGRQTRCVGETLLSQVTQILSGKVLAHIFYDVNTYCHWCVLVLYLCCMYSNNLSWPENT